MKISTSKLQIFVIDEREGIEFEALMKLIFFQLIHIGI